MKLAASVRIMRSTLRYLSYIAPTTVGQFYAKKFMTPRRRKRPRWENQIIASANFTSTINGRCFWVWGEGPTILFVHGWEGRGSQFGKFVDPLVKSGFRVVLWDGPAHGDSVGETTNIVAYARSLLEMQTHLGPILGVVAHSFGGNTARLAFAWGLKTDTYVQISSPRSVQNLFDRFTDFVGISPRAAKAFQKYIEGITGVSVDAVDTSNDLSGSEFPETLAIHSKDDCEVPFSDSASFVAPSGRLRLLEVNGLGHRNILKDGGIVRLCCDFLKMNNFLTLDGLPRLGLTQEKR